MPIECRCLANGSNLRGRAVNPRGIDPEFLEARLKHVQDLLETPERRARDVGEDGKACSFASDY